MTLSGTTVRRGDGALTADFSAANITIESTRLSSQGMLAA